VRAPPSSFFLPFLRRLSISPDAATLLLPGRRPMRRVAAHGYPDSSPPLDCCSHARKGTGYGDEIEMGEGETRLGWNMTLGKNWFCSVSVIYRSSLYLVLG